MRFEGHLYPQKLEGQTGSGSFSGIFVSKHGTARSAEINQVQEIETLSGDATVIVMGLAILKSS